MDNNGERSDAGRLIGGRYRLVERIGSGGMGTVWHAVDELVGRDVAVKQPRLPGDPHGPAQQRAYARLRREARAAAGVDHPSAVTVHDVVVEDELPWIVMELVRGESLHELLARGPLAPHEAARIGLAVLGALRAAHTKGIVHRDVKPANVLLGAHGRVVLTDFGIAHIQGEESLTVSGEFVGSLECIAPERMSGDGAGPASDLWSLGVLLYAAVEGWSPFRRTTLESTLAAILSFDPPEAERAGALGPLITRLLAKDPAMRPEAAEVAADLEAALDPAASPARPADPGTVRLTRAEALKLEPEAESTAPEPAAPGPTVPESAATEPARRPKSRRTPALLAAALAGALLVGGGVWLGTSLGSGPDGKGDSYTTGEEVGEGEVGSLLPEAPNDPATQPATPSRTPSDKGWTAHKEPDLKAVISVPDAFTDAYHDPSRDGVQYSDPHSDVTLSLKVWKQGSSSAVDWATSVGNSYGDNGYSDIRRTVTRTTFHGKEAAQLDITYLNADESATMREMRLYVVDGKNRYDFAVVMPKGVSDYEKQGTDAFKGGRDRLRLEGL
ncbi:serine/threonine-protein kinase [Streptomyces sp. VRA16 Mangrove soil]|uniref:serine/threonine-protein kinase n=1 Tax=Streptomyces sp. VRA16 Mangrove soil TaxID=2817434 RepID=UPI001A9F0F26|nr:serine/threonine-protein kinase [Streptomyces sp. VRA16 Mangrove soil]MBO1335105.1 protein kinase [Streptomyces sp. VRA16 Mangrove soil]